MLVANRKATDAEKRQFMQFVQRVDDQLKAGAEDAHSKVDDILLALEMQRDRRREADRSALVAAGNSAMRNAKAVKGLLGKFGG
jgi:hypothetical protein